MRKRERWACWRYPKNQPTRTPRQNGLIFGVVKKLPQIATRFQTGAGSLKIPPYSPSRQVDILGDHMRDRLGDH